MHYNYNYDCSWRRGLAMCTYKLCCIIYVYIYVDTVRQWVCCFAADWVTAKHHSQVSANCKAMHMHRQSQSSLYIYELSLSNSTLRTPSCSVTRAMSTALLLPCVKGVDRKNTHLCFMHTWSAYLGLLTAAKGVPVWTGRSPVALLSMCGRWKGSPPAAYPEVLYWGEGCLNIMHSIGCFCCLGWNWKEKPKRVPPGDLLCCMGCHYQSPGIFCLLLANLVGLWS